MTDTHVTHVKVETRSLPVGWRWMPLGEMVRIDKVQIPPGVEGFDQLPYLGMENIVAYSYGAANYQNEDTNGERGACFQFDHRHVLYGRLRPYLNKVHLPEAPGRCSTEIIPLLPLGGVDRRYIAWLLRSPSMVAYAVKWSTGSRMPRADMGRLLALHVPAPVDPGEQAKIAARLEAEMAKVSRIRRAAEEQLAAATSVLLSRFRQTFESEEAVMWKPRKLCEVAQVKLGRQRSPENRSRLYPTKYLRVANVFRNRIDVSDILEMEFTPRERERYKLQVGDLLLCEGQSSELVGRCAMWNGEIPDCCFQNTLIRVRCNRQEILPLFALYRLAYASDIGDLTRLSNKTTNMAHLGATRLAGYQFRLPNTTRQQEIVDLIQEETGAVQRIIAAAEHQLEATNALPGSWLRRVFHDSSLPNRSSERTVENRYG